MGLHRQGAVVALMLALLAFTALYAVEGRPLLYNDEGLELSKPKEVFRSDGGTLEVWNPKHQVMQDASVIAVRATLEPRGLGLFHYSDVSQLVYVVQGRAKIGLSYPWEQSANIRTVKKGDVIAIPQGVPHWWYNDGDQRFVAFVVGDTSRGQAGERDSLTFFLHGASGKECGSVLHGFDEELLSEAWDVDRDIVKQVRENQKGQIIIKLDHDLDIRTESGRSEGSEELWEDFTYKLDEAKPDLEVEHGGSFHLLSKKSLPILKEVGLSVMRVKLEQEAMCAPLFSSNAHILLYVTKGSGRIQIVGNGKQLLDLEVEEGTLVLIPQFHPMVKKAGKNGLETIAIATSDLPIFNFLAGKNSIYKNVPVEVLAASNNVDVEVEQQILDRRQHDALIFPPRRQSNAAANGVFYA